MMKNKLTVLLADIDNGNYTSYYIESCRTIIQVLLLVDEEKIGKDSDAKIESDGTFEIRLISQSLNQINIYISVFKNGIVDIQVDKGGEYLYLQEMNSDEDVLKLRETLNDLLRNTITIDYYLINDVIKKIVYKVPYNDSGKNLEYKFAVILGAKGIFKKYTVSQKVFEPWIE